MVTSVKMGTLLGAAAIAIATAWSGHGMAAPRYDAQPASLAGDPFNVSTAVVGDCKAGSECTAKITINVTADEYHVNDQYPFKFTATPPAGVELHGAKGATFQDGDFLREHKTATMTVKFKPSAKGSFAIAGKYKICVCSDKTCEPKTIDVSNRPSR